MNDPNNFNGTWVMKSSENNDEVPISYGGLNILGEYIEYIGRIEYIEYKCINSFYYILF